MSIMNSIFMIVRVTRFLDANSREDKEEELWTDSGYFVSEEEALQYCKSLNRPQKEAYEDKLKRLEADYNGQLKAYRRKKKEHETLLAAGLKHMEPLGPTPTAPTSLGTDWRSQDCYIEFTVVEVFPHGQDL